MDKEREREEEKNGEFERERGIGKTLSVFFLQKPRVIPIAMIPATPESLDRIDAHSDRKENQKKMKRSLTS